MVHGTTPNTVTSAWRRKQRAIGCTPTTAHILGQLVRRGIWHCNFCDLDLSLKSTRMTLTS